MSFETKIDNVIMDGQFGVQEAANLAERLTGIKYYNLSRSTIVVADAILMGSVFADMRGVEVPEAVVVTILFWGAFILFFTYRVWQITEYARSNTSRGRKNPHRDHPVEVIRRTLFLFLGTLYVCVSLLTGFWSFMDGFVLAMAAAFYFAACEEAPPHHQTAPTY